jgi:predicted amidohydrolase
MYDTFSQIAREHDLWVVAGSALLPRNRHGDTAREYAPADARTYNTSYTFDPSGALAGVTRKVNLVPTQEDVLHLSGAPADELSALDTPFGKLGTLICYDGFAEAHTAQEPGWVACGPVVDRLGVEVLAQPSANAWAWDAPWAFNEPGEDLLRREQWFVEGMPTTLRGLRNVRYVVNPQLVGEVLDNHFEAPSLILARTPAGEVEVIGEAGGPLTEEIVAARAPVQV